MAETHSLAKRKQWATKTREERFEIMSKVSKAKQEQMTEEERRSHALMMVQARKQKQHG